MDWNNNIASLEPCYVQCSRDGTKEFIVYKLIKFQRDIMDCCIWIKISDAIEWCQYNSLYFSNGVIGVYDPSNVYYDSLIRIEFNDPLDASTIECGLYFSFLNQFELGIENKEIIDGINYIAEIIH